MPDSFFDSNILIYMTSGDALKARRAGELVVRGGTISVQVLNEVVYVGRRKLRMSWHELHRFLDALTDALTVVPMTVETHRHGLLLAERHGLSTYDAMIVAAATLSSCSRVWSEDMHDGLQIDAGPIIIDPFRSV